MDRLIEVKVNGSHIRKDSKRGGVQGEANVTILRIEFDPTWDGYAKTVVFFNALGQKPTKRVLTADLLEDIAASPRIYRCPIPGEALEEAGWFSFIIDGYSEGKRPRSAEDSLYADPAPNTDNAGEPVDPTPSQTEQLQVQIDTILEDMSAQARQAQNSAGAAATSEANAANSAAGAEAARIAAENAAQSAKTSAQEAANSANEAKQNVESALQEAKESGEFDGPRGPQGEPGVPPIVGENGNWHIWDGETYIDTGYSATALHNENGGGLVKMWFGTIAEYNALDTIYNDVLYHIIEGAIPV